MKAAGQLSERAVFLMTFALCGFANLGSVGIQLGGIGALIAGLVNAGKWAGIVRDGTAPTWASALNIAALMIDQGEWGEINDVNDFLKAHGPQDLHKALKKVRKDGKTPTP
jgi:hypothetical protein